MILSRSNLKSLEDPGLIVPNDSIFQLPEKVLQFGTGVLLRGLPDYFIDKANRQGIFNGRIVVVKSTSSGSSSAFDTQDGLYTLAVKGIENGKRVEENIVCSAISRVLSATSEWNEILRCAQNPEMKIVISNTTEVGLQLVLEKIDQTPPASFPAKLLAFLDARYKAFNGSEASGMVVIPTELIPDNGKKLKSILLALAEFNTLSDGFIQWMSTHNFFCNSLVDRIVPGKPDDIAALAFQKQFGYEDELLTAAEVYRLWAIEGNEKVKSVLSFSKADGGVIIAPDIEIYRELKLRLLNGTHTLSCGTAYLSGFETVVEAMEHDVISEFVSGVMKNEIAPSIPYNVNSKEALDFSNSVLDRFRNPHIKHLWINITVQYSMKIKMRVLPVLLKHYEVNKNVPNRIALGFAAWILFMKSVEKKGNSYFGERKSARYPINDDQAEYFYNQWQKHGEDGIVHAILSDKSFWGVELTDLAGFEATVNSNLKSILSKGVLQTIREQQ
ncbi:MAG TPA: tagaturonate reductase [Cyclobacteriaceae bacterium]|jgi:tagaturonate reductase|nr:tagaturonate reductase [Cyclobacteriaceae bacterium]